MKMLMSYYIYMIYIEYLIVYLLNQVALKFEVTTFWDSQAELNIQA
ncbi:MAG: hypothetical protein ACI8O8_002762 [Oleiphilaceae bacterium]|jgi:hypothetical protein